MKNYTRINHVVKEAKEFKPYVNLQTGSGILSFIIAFVVDYVPLAMGASFPLWFLLFVLFFAYAFLICKLAYIVIVPGRIKIADMNTYLLNNGEPLRAKIGHVTFVNIFSKTIYYRKKLKTGEKVTYMFNTKDNYYDRK